MAFSVATLRNRIRAKSSAAVEEGKSLRQVLLADAVAASAASSTRSISSTSANGASVEFDANQSNHPDKQNQVADQLLTIYEASIDALAVTEADDDSSQAAAISSEMLSRCVSIRSFRPDFSTLGVNQ